MASTTTPSHPTDPLSLGAPSTLLAKDGAGRLLRRQYSVRIEDAKVSATEMVEIFRRDLPLFVPKLLADFKRADGNKAPLSVGDEFTIKIPFVPLSHVRVAEITTRSMTLQTVKEHPEAGRITFAAFDVGGGLELVIRSRARASSLFSLFGYLVMGKAMQTRTWISCLTRAAEAAGGSIVGTVKVQTVAVDETSTDREENPGSTFETYY